MPKNYLATVEDNKRSRSGAAHRDWLGSAEDVVGEDPLSTSSHRADFIGDVLKDVPFDEPSSSPGDGNGSFTTPNARRASGEDDPYNSEGSLSSRENLGYSNVLPYRPGTVNRSSRYAAVYLGSTQEEPVVDDDLPDARDPSIPISKRVAEEDHTPDDAPADDDETMEILDGPSEFSPDIDVEVIDLILEDPDSDLNLDPDAMQPDEDESEGEADTPLDLDPMLSLDSEISGDSDGYDDPDAGNPDGAPDVDPDNFAAPETLPESEDENFASTAAGNFDPDEMNDLFGLSEGSERRSNVVNPDEMNELFGLTSASGRLTEAAALDLEPWEIRPRILKNARVLLLGTPPSALGSKAGLARTLKSKYGVSDVQPIFTKNTDVVFYDRASIQPAQRAKISGALELIEYGTFLKFVNGDYKAPDEEDED